MVYETLADLFKGICDAIRVKKGTSDVINHQDIPNEIRENLAVPKTVIHNCFWTNSRTITFPKFSDADTAFYAYEGTLGGDGATVVGGYVSDSWLCLVTTYGGSLEGMSWSINSLPAGISVTIDDNSYTLHFTEGECEYTVAPEYYYVTCGE